MGKPDHSKLVFRQLFDRDSGTFTYFLFDSEIHEKASSHLTIHDHEVVDALNQRLEVIGQRPRLVQQRPRRHVEGDLRARNRPPQQRGELVVPAGHGGHRRPVTWLGPVGPVARGQLAAAGEHDRVGFVVFV